MVGMTKSYKEGETYWVRNPLAGRNRQSCGILIGWTEDGKAILMSKRWGVLIVTVENLKEHNNEQ